MNKKQRKALERQKKEKVKSQRKARQRHDPEKWREKQKKKKDKQKVEKNCKYPNIPSGCYLKEFQNPSKINCEGCTINCAYHP